MARLADALRYYIHDRITNDPAWAKIQVILSDANVPGEGEHKIMDFIRKQRANSAHNPDTVHCLCGADADLIMLGLATHEANFNIIREEFIPNQQPTCQSCGKYGHELKSCRGPENESSGEDHADPLQKMTDFIFVRLPVLREYLEKEMAMPNLPFIFDLERVIDDWVFICFFVGNDFVPHLPSLEIREGAIDRLIKLYKETVKEMNGYMTKDGEVDMEQVQKIMIGLGKVENEIFQRRRAEEERFRQRKIKWQGMNDGGRGRGQTDRSSYAAQATEYSESEETTITLKTMLKIEGTSAASACSAEHINRMSEVSLIIPKENAHTDPVDEIRLYEAGWKDRYYRAKFDVGPEDMKFRETVAWAYVKGLCWVLKYYYQGCASWDWYFPYHYAPFASDFNTIINFKPDFTRPTKPFKPLEQLMSVFPAASKQHLPLEWQKLMTEDDSPIIDLYPNDFHIDLNGKKLAWQGVALLPFVDEARLLKALQQVYPSLTEEEKARNTIGPNRLFIGRHHPAFKFFLRIYHEDSQSKTVEVDPAFTYGVTGTISTDTTAVLLNSTFPSPVCDPRCPDLPVNGTLGVLYDDPSYPEGHIFPATRLETATAIPRTLKPGDWNDRSVRNGWAYVDQSGNRNFNHEIRNADGFRSRGNCGYGWPRGRGGGYNSCDNRGSRGGYRGGYNSNDNRGGRGGYRGGYNSNDNRGRRGEYRGGYNSNDNRGCRGGYRGGYNDGGYRNNYNGDGWELGEVREQKEARLRRRDAKARGP